MPVRSRAPLALVIAIVTSATLFLFPSECSCGATEPHPHALFELPGHHHRPGAAGARPDELSGPQLAQASTTSIANWLAVHAIFSNIPLTPGSGAMTPRPDRDLTRSGRAVRPEPPPPRRVPLAESWLIDASIGGRDATTLPS